MVGLDACVQGAATRAWLASWAVPGLRQTEWLGASWLDEDDVCGLFVDRDNVYRYQRLSGTINVSLLIAQFDRWLIVERRHD